MEEYVILVESPMDIQKKLNQWRHEYRLNILGFAQSDRNDNKLAIILTRTRRTI